jgi:hypothetical protein
VGEVGALQFGPHRPVTGSPANQLQVAFTGGTAAVDQPLGDLKNARMHVLDSRLSVVATSAAVSLINNRHLGSKAGATVAGGTAWPIARCRLNKILPAKTLVFYFFTNNLVIPTTKSDSVKQFLLCHGLHPVYQR